MFSKIDLRFDYNQILVMDEDVHKTIFWSRYKHYEYVVMSFGMTNDFSLFMDCMNRTFMPFLDKFVVVFINDILIYSQIIKEHISTMLSILKEKQLYAKLANCEFWKQKVQFLGHDVSV